MALPPNVTEAEFSAALDEFSAAVGADWVFSSDEDVALYRDSYSIYWGEPEERLASAAVAPASVEEVQQVVRIANRFGIPLYPISTGRNLNYGGAAPNTTGSVVVDLKRMNRVLEVDEDRHFALVEPGVSYFDLYAYIKERDLKVVIDVPDPGWGSPVGNSLDHGIGFGMAPFRDHFAAHCGMEVVTPEGDVIRTGMGALPGSDTWQEFRYGAGPSVDGLFAQSNFGIVTKMGFWLMPMPEAYLTGTVSVPRYQDLIAMVKEVNYLEDSFLTGLPSYSSPVAGGTVPNPALATLMENGWPSLERVEQFVDSQDRPAWSVTLPFYGPEESVRAHWSAARRRFASAIAGAVFEEGEFRTFPIPPEDEANLREKRLFGIPSLEAFTLTSRTALTADDPPEGHADLLIIMPRKAQENWDLARVLYELYTELGLPPITSPFSAPSPFFPRSFLRFILVPTWRDPERNRRSREIFSQIIDRCAEHGWGDYRTSPAFQEQLVGTYSYNNSSLLRFQEKLKDGIDPNGIISPGRYGIWPANMRSGRA